MRHGNYVNEEGPVNWRIIRHLVPYLMESRNRVAVAMLCLLLAKGSILLIPFLLKYLVDALEGADLQSLAPTLLLGLVLAYGGARFANVFFAELRDTIFGKVTERAMRRIGLRVFRHVHALDLAFHLDRRTGGLARDIERGTTGDQLPDALFRVQHRPHPVRDHHGGGDPAVQLRHRASP